MTISACHMQRCMPVLIPPPPHTRIRARAHRRRPSGASASPPNARPVACRARPVVPAPTRHSRTQKIKGRPITHTQQARVGARTHMQTRTNRQGEYCGFCVCVFVCVCVCVCVCKRKFEFVCARARARVCLSALRRLCSSRVCVLVSKKCGRFLRAFARFVLYGRVGRCFNERASEFVQRETGRERLWKEKRRVSWCVCVYTCVHPCACSSFSCA